MFSTAVKSALTALLLLTFFSGATRAETKEPFQLYTAYSKKGLLPEQYGDKVIVVFHGFLSAMPNGFYKAFQKKLKGDFTVLGFTYEYFDPEQTIAKFDAFHKQYLSGKSLIYAGSSLGGFWADFFAARHGVAKVMTSNPLIVPGEAMFDFVGTHFSEKRNKDIVVTDAEVRRYDGLSLDPTAPVERLVVVTLDDDRSDANDTIAFFQTNPKSIVVALSKGGHTLNYRKHFVWPMVEAWIRR